MEYVQHKIVNILLLVVLCYNFLRVNRLLKGENTDKLMNMIGILCVIMAMKRDFFLPFLGDCVIPNGILDEKMPVNAETKLCIKIKPNVKIIYWASEQGEDARMPWEAYKAYENAGVTKSDINGDACFYVRNPGSYKVPYKGKLEPHIHYRYEKSKGMFSRIYTVKL